MSGDLTQSIFLFQRGRLEEGISNGIVASKSDESLLLVPFPLTLS